MRIQGLLLLAAACGLAACKAESKLPSGAALLFDVAFSAPENSAGAAPTLVDPNATQPWPSKSPSQIFMGAPKVVAELCGLTDQPLALTSASGQQSHEGVEFLLDQRYGHYHIELDVCAQQIGIPPLQAMEPQLAIFLDIPQAYAIGFFEKGRIVVIDQVRGIDAVLNPEVIGRYELGKPLHLAIDFDTMAQTWSIAFDGKQAFAGKLAPVLPRAVRVVIRGNESNAAAIDNFVVWAENDLSMAAPEESGEVPK